MYVESNQWTVVHSVKLYLLVKNIELFLLKENWKQKNMLDQNYWDQVLLYQIQIQI